MTKPTVTDAMVEAAGDILVKWYFAGNKTLKEAVPAAITAALEASGILDLIAKADAVLDHADQHCRAFPIATAPKKRLIQVWDTDNKAWRPYCLIDNYKIDSKFTHWAEYLPPPSSPPLPAVFTQLGQALEKIKEGR